MIQIRVYRENSVETDECITYKIKDEHYIYLYSDTKTIPQENLKGILNIRNAAYVDFDYDFNPVEKED